jgi:hypothetical protein
MSQGVSLRSGILDRLADWHSINLKTGGAFHGYLRAHKLTKGFD